MKEISWWEAKWKRRLWREGEGGKLGGKERPWERGKNVISEQKLGQDV